MADLVRRGRIRALVERVVLPEHVRESNQDENGTKSHDSPANTPGYSLSWCDCNGQAPGQMAGQR